MRQIVAAAVPSVRVIVLNWNQADVTKACLSSLVTDRPQQEILVVDNGSTDQSVRAINEAFPLVDLVATGANLGYAGGNNAGIRRALEQGADYVCILNNDTLVEPGWLDALIRVLEADERAGVATPLIVYASQPDQVWALGAAVSWRTGEVSRLHAEEQRDSWQDRDPFPVDVAVGTAMLVKRKVFEQAGLLDERFFLYYEEVDWSLHVREADSAILAVPAGVVRHKVSGTLGLVSPTIDYYMTRNHLLFVSRHWVGLRKLFVLSRIVLRSLATIAAYTLKSRGGQRLAHRNARMSALLDALRGRWGQARSASLRVRPSGS